MKTGICTIKFKLYLMKLLNIAFTSTKVYSNHTYFYCPLKKEALNMKQIRLLLLGISKGSEEGHRKDAWCLMRNICSVLL